MNARVRCPQKGRRYTPEDKAFRRAMVVNYLRQHGAQEAAVLAKVFGWSDVALRMLLVELMADGCVARRLHGGVSRPYEWTAT